MKRILQGIKIGFRDEGGQTLVLVVASMVALMGFLGLAIDVGQLRATEHKLQQAADAAALAGALELSYCGGTLACSTMTTAAEKALTLENGLTLNEPSNTPMTQCNTTSEPNTGIVLMVNNGPCLLGSADPNNGSSKVVEAEVIYEDAPTYFARVIGLNKVRLTARAEAGRGPFPYCFGANIDATVVGGAKITASCSGQDNGNLSLGSGGSTHITTTGFNYDGTLSGSTSGMTPPPTHGAASLSDPLTWLNNDDLPQCTSSLTTGCVPASTVNGSNTSDPCDNQNIATSNSGSFTWDSAHSQWNVTGPVYVSPSSRNPANDSYTLSSANPAYSNGTGPVPQVNICGNINISGGGGLIFTNTSTTLAVFNGSITSTSNAGTSYTATYTGANNVSTTASANNVILGGTNITMYFSNGSIGDEHSNNVLLYAPATGPYEGVLYYVPTTNTSTLYIASGANSSWQGIVYDPDGTVDVSDGGNLAAYQFFWAGHLILDHGSGMTVAQNFSSLAGGAPIVGVTAVLSE